jgi:hypothetical protein
LSSTITEERSLLSRESVEEQTLHSHAIIGTPCDVPVPKKVILTCFPPML